MRPRAPEAGESRAENTFMRSIQRAAAILGYKALTLCSPKSTPASLVTTLAPEEVEGEVETRSFLETDGWL